jgi:hypothetical protein
MRAMKSRKMIRVGHLVCRGKTKNACRILVGKPERKKSPMRSRYKFKAI